MCIMIDSGDLYNVTLFKFYLTGKQFNMGLLPLKLKLPWTIQELMLYNDHTCTKTK